MNAPPLQSMAPSGRQRWSELTEGRRRGFSNRDGSDRDLPPDSAGGPGLRTTQRRWPGTSNGADPECDVRKRSLAASIRAAKLYLTRLWAPHHRCRRCCGGDAASADCAPLLANDGGGTSMPSASCPPQQSGKRRYPAHCLSDYAGRAKLASASPSCPRNLASSGKNPSERQRSILVRLVAAVDPANSEQIATSLLAEFRSLAVIWVQTPEALARVLSAWPSIVPLLLSARDAAIEVMRSDLKMRTIDSFDPALRKYLIASMGSLPDERLRILFLDSSRRLLSDEELQQGSLAQIAIYPRTIFRRALEHNAAAMIIVHNHPSGDLSPSTTDISATRRMEHIARALEIELLDHIVVTAKGIHHIVKVSALDGPSESASLRLKSADFSSFRDWDTVILSNARITVNRRILRRQLIGAEDLFGEPAWDMLLDLFIHEYQGETLSMFAMCAGTGVPMSSAMRLAQKLCDAEILRRVPDPNDRRRSLMKIEPAIAHRMRAYFSEGVE